MKVDYSLAKFQKMTVEIDGDSITGLFSNSRIIEGTQPLDSLILYIRHDDTGEPATIEKHVFVDFYGVFVVPKDEGIQWFNRHMNDSSLPGFVEVDLEHAKWHWNYD